MVSHIVVWHWLIQAACGGSVLLLTGCVLCLLCRQPVQRLRVIELALLGCLVVPWLSQVPALPHRSVGLLRESLAAPPAPEASRAGVGESIGRPDFEPLSSAQSVTPPAEAVGATPGVAAAPVVPISEAPQTAKTQQAPELPLWSLLGVLAYVAGVAVLVLRWLVGAWKLRQLRRTARAVPPEVTTLFADIAGPAGRNVHLIESDRVALPLTFGWRRPVIVVPACLCREGDVQGLCYGLAHEWSHVERGDIGRWHLATLVQFLFFWQPLYWWLRRQLRLDQDYLADALAAQQAPETEDYAGYLVRLARRSLLPPLAGTLGISDRKSNLYRRVLMVIHHREPFQRRCRALWNLAAVAVAALLVGTLSAVRLDAGTAAGPEDPPKKEAAKDQAVPQGEKLDYSGKVTDKDTGEPIAGATVTVRRSLYGDPEAKSEDWILQETKHQTDAAGKYAFTIPPEQSARKYLYIELDVEAPHYAPQKHFGYALGMILKNEKLGGRPFFENVTLRRAEEIRGVLERPDGKPAAGVKVMSYSVTNKLAGNQFEYGSFADTKTDEQGRFSLPIVTPGDGAFWILPKQYAPSTHALKAGKRGDLGRFGLQEGIGLKGKAVDAQGKPVAGIFLHADKDSYDEALAGLRVADMSGRVALTNEKGEFQFAPLAPGTYRIQPREYGGEPSDDTQSYVKHPVPAVFLTQKVTLSTAEKPAPLEVRAVPHVIVEAQYYDSQGKPRRGHAPHLFGQLDGQPWFAEAKADADGKVTVLAPHGLEQARLSMMTNEHSALRHRKSKSEPLSRARDMNLGTLDHDVKGIEIIRYEAPILLIKVVTKEGAKPKDAGVSARYPEEKGLQEGRFIGKKGRRTDVNFEEQEDGRFRSEQLLPDEEVTVTAHAEGSADQSQTVKLAEGTTKEIEIVLEKN